MSELAPGRLVSQLKRVGARPPQQLVEQILAVGPAALEPLLQLATDRQLLRAGGAEIQGPIHALRLLGELRSPRIVAPLLELFPLDEEEYALGDELLALWEREVPQILARVGPAVRDELWSVARDDEQPDWRRHVAIGALAHLGTIEPGLREELAAGLLAIVAEATDPTVVASAIAGLGLLNVTAAYGEVMAAYRDKRVNTEIISAAMARQLLLAKPNQESKSCAGHPLWERYDEHGPAPQPA